MGESLKGCLLTKNIPHHDRACALCTDCLQLSRARHHKPRGHVPAFPPASFLQGINRYEARPVLEARGFRGEWSLVPEGEPTACAGFLRRARKSSDDGEIHLAFAARFLSAVRAMTGLPTIPAPFDRFQGTIRPEWIDGNGHLNLGYTVVLFDQATDVLFDALDIGNAYRDSTRHGLFAVETHTLYERELLQGEAMRVVTTVLGADAKRLHVAHEMFPDGAPARAAMQEIMFVHVDLGTRKVTPFPPLLIASLATAAAAHAVLPRPAGIGRRVAMPA